MGFVFSRSVVDGIGQDQATFGVCVVDFDGLSIHGVDTAIPT